MVLGPDRAQYNTMTDDGDDLVTTTVGCQSSDDVTDGWRVRGRRMIGGDDRGLLMVRLHVMRHVRHRVAGVVDVSEHRFGLLHHVRLSDDRHVWRRHVHFGQDHRRYESVRWRGVHRHCRRKDAINSQCHLFIDNSDIVFSIMFKNMMGGEGVHLLIQYPKATTICHHLELLQFFAKRSKLF